VKCVIIITAAHNAATTTTTTTTTTTINTAAFTAVYLGPIFLCICQVVFVQVIEVGL
jgi:hypothetical protein